MGSCFSRHSDTRDFTISFGKLILVCRYARKRTHFIVGFLRFYVFVVMDFGADAFKGCCCSKCFFAENVQLHSVAGNDFR